MSPLFTVELTSKRKKKIPECIKFLLWQCSGSFCPPVTAHHENAIQWVTQPRGDNRDMNYLNYQFYGALNLHSQKGTTGVFQEFIPRKNAQPFHIYSIFPWKIYSIENPFLHLEQERQKKFLLLQYLFLVNNLAETHHDFPLLKSSILIQNTDGQEMQEYWIEIWRTLPFPLALKFPSHCVLLLYLQRVSTQPFSEVA